ncbi:hypothetical protein [Mycobacteroides abscessus]|uniref:hypothetical protein n=1 Tax=Mycobacteroides abscessus TaxID=36809 RepID=UPI0019D0B7A3|nr:hypothetical protein [Mycobacteroides abscessus]MBN7457366.1 hypothetical protein [Mycobacteroides abscessus subsp. abscessus]
MTAAICVDTTKDTASALEKLRDVTVRLYASQADMRSLSMERRELVAKLRRQGLPLRVIAEFVGTTPQAIWLLTKNTGEES